MRDILAIVGAVLALSLPGVALAQRPPGGGGGQLTQSFARGTVTGKVTSVNPAAGEVKLRSGKHTISFYGLPVQLSGLVPGDEVALPYQNFGGRRWLPLQFNRGHMQMRGQYEQQGSFTGAIQKIDRKAGKLVIHGATFRIHPAMLSRLRGSELVTVQYATIDGRHWITGIQLARGHGVGPRPSGPGRVPRAAGGGLAPYAR